MCVGLSRIQQDGAEYPLLADLFYPADDPPTSIALRQDAAGKEAYDQSETRKVYDMAIRQCTFSTVAYKVPSAEPAVSGPRAMVTSSLALHPVPIINEIEGPAKHFRSMVEY